jgi:hypothetical protein
MLGDKRRAVRLTLEGLAIADPESLILAIPFPVEA